MFTRSELLLELIVFAATDIRPVLSLKAVDDPEGVGFKPRREHLSIAQIYTQQSVAPVKGANNCAKN
jgi:hypothetical protein